MTPANITQVIDVLEREGLVERVANRNDRRVTYARLTPRGEDICARMVPAMVALMEQTCASLSEEEKLELARLLAKFRRDLRLRFS